MIVVGIIALLAAIAIPMYLRTLLNADETAAIASLKSLGSAEEMLRVNNPDYADWVGLSTANPPYITGFVPLAGFQYCYKQRYYFYVYNAAGQVSGYHTQPQNYTVYAEPHGTPSGARSFCAHRDGIVRVFTSSGCGPWPDCCGNAIGQ